MHKAVHVDAHCIRLKTAYQMISIHIITLIELLYVAGSLSWSWSESPFTIDISKWLPAGTWQQKAYRPLRNVGKDKTKVTGYLNMCLTWWNIFRKVTSNERENCWCVSAVRLRNLQRHIKSETSLKGPHIVPLAPALLGTLQVAGLRWKFASRLLWSVLSA